MRRSAQKPTAHGAMAGSTRATHGFVFTAGRRVRQRRLSAVRSRAKALNRGAPNRRVVFGARGRSAISEKFSCSLFRFPASRLHCVNTSGGRFSSRRISSQLLCAADGRALAAGGVAGLAKPDFRTIPSSWRRRLESRRTQGLSRRLRLKGRRRGVVDAFLPDEFEVRASPTECPRSHAG